MRARYHIVNDEGEEVVVHNVVRLKQMHHVHGSSSETFNGELYDEDGIGLVKSVTPRVADHLIDEYDFAPEDHGIAVYNVNEYEII